MDIQKILEKQFHWMFFLVIKTRNGNVDGDSGDVDGDSGDDDGDTIYFL
jgi:hypothetical protein